MNPKVDMTIPERNTFQDVVEMTVEKLLKLKAAVKTTSEPIVVDGVTVIPVAKVSVGFAGGGADISDRQRGKSKHPAGAGAGISETPVSFLVIEGGTATIVKVAAEDAASKGVDLVQAAVKLFQKFKKQKENN